MGVMEARRRILLNQPHLIDASGNPIAFQTDMAAKMGVKAYFSPVQEGTGDPSPSNVRPITGWTGCEVTRCRKNLFNEANANLILSHNISSTGAIQTASDYCYLPGYISAEANKDFAISINKTSNAQAAIHACYYDANKNFISRESSGVTTYIGQITFSFTTPNNCRYLRFNFPISISNIQLELGSTATAYEPYSGSSYPVTFPAEAGTLYGGYVDYERGEVEYDRVAVTLDGQTNEVITAYNEGSNGDANWLNVSLSVQHNPAGNGFAFIVGNTENVGRSISSFLRYKYDNVTTYAHYYKSSGIAIFVSKTDFPTVSDFTTWLSQNPQTIILPITPVSAGSTSYSISPQQIKSLKGANTIWSDLNENVDLKYWKH